MAGQVEIIVNPDGSTQIGVSCVKGSDCKKLTEEIERALGVKTKDSPTSEMFEKEKTNVTTRR